MRAPLPKVPQEGKRRKDTKHMGTIEQDPDYMEFLAELEKEPEAPKTAEQLMAAREAEEAKAKELVEDEVTPLVAFMRKKRDEKERRQKRRALPRSRLRGREVDLPRHRSHAGSLRGPEHATARRRRKRIFARGGSRESRNS